MSDNLDADGWRPIKTAPKDGTRILACTAGYAVPTMAMDRDFYRTMKFSPATVYWFRPPFAPQRNLGEGWYDVRDRPFGDRLTHWMPLPLPPTG